MDLCAMAQFYRGANMPQINVMSWNIQDFGVSKYERHAFSRIRPRDGKPSIFALIANIAFNQNVDLLLIMEVTPSVAVTVAQSVMAELNALQVNLDASFTWGLVSSVGTGALRLPPVISAGGAASPRFKSAAMAVSYAANIASCYDRVDDASGEIEGFTLKATLPSTQQQEQCVQALISAGVLKKIGDLESYVALFRYDSAHPWTNSTAGVTLNAPACTLVFTDPAGNRLGYDIPGSQICGRSPFLLPLTVGSGATALSVPLLLFHAPFLDKLTDAMSIRIAAMTTLMQLGVPASGTAAPVAMGQSPAGVICGDFNINYVPGAPAGTDSANSYGVLAGAPNLFVPSISEANSAPPPAQIGMPSTVGESGTKCNAYDNIFYKLPTAPSALNATIFDPSPLWTKPNVLLGYTSANSVNALKAYTTWISDHLPAVLKVTFP